MNCGNINKNMKVVLPIEEGYFNIIPNKFCGLDCYLITPEIDAKWNKNNLFYRSLITDKEGNVLSSGFPKFFNYGEKPDCYPDPENFNDWRYEDKIDGSLLIADYVNDTFSMRTRGTVSYSSQENAKDFERLPDKYPKVVDFLKENQHLSLLFEIVTPNNVIVVRPQQIEFYLIGAINKNGMVVVSPSDLTNIWRKIGPIPCPQNYEFLNTNSISKIADTIKYWKGKEGVVISYNNGQNRIKLKSDWYLFIHRVKSQLNSENNLIEYYVDCEMPSCEDFYKKIETEFDYEIVVQLKDQIQKICDAGKLSKKYIDNILDMIHDIRKVETRKEQAEMITRNYKENSSYAFSILDNKEITKQQWIKLLHKFYEKNN
jgi:hypothetical protein